MYLACEDTGPLRELAVYRPRRPQDSVLHRVMRGHLETYLALRREDPQGEAVSGHVERTFREYLKCGIPAHGIDSRCDSRLRRRRIGGSGMYTGCGYSPVCNDLAIQNASRRSVFFRDEAMMRRCCTLNDGSFIPAPDIIVKPATVIRWRKKKFREHWTRKSRHWWSRHRLDASCRCRIIWLKLYGREVPCRRSSHCGSTRA